MSPIGLKPSQSRRLAKSARMLSWTHLKPVAVLVLVLVTVPVAVLVLAVAKVGNLGRKARVLVTLPEVVHLLEVVVIQAEAAVPAVNYFGTEETSQVTYRLFKKILTHL